jgi:hypothetical protein
MRTVILLKTVAHRCIQSLRGVSMTDSEGLWPQLVHCAPHLSTVPVISQILDLSYSWIYGLILRLDL